MTELMKAGGLVESKAAYWDSMTVDLKAALTAGCLASQMVETMVEMKVEVRAYLSAETKAERMVA